jgi:hypothetical protein
MARLKPANEAGQEVTNIMVTTPADPRRRRRQRARFRRLLSRQLQPPELQIVLDVLRAEQHGKAYRVSRLGFGEDLIRRNWLERDAHGNVSLSANCRALLNDESEASR